MNLVSYASSSSGSSSSSRNSSPAFKKKKATTTRTASPKGAHHPGKQKESLPPLPPGFANLYTSTPRASTGDDPSLHGGRQRSIAHADGTWPTHVYVEWTPNAADSAILASAIASASAPPFLPSSSSSSGFPSPTTSSSGGTVHSLLRSPLGAPAPLHISLSRTLPVQTAQREPFLAQLRAALGRIQLPLSSSLSPSTSASISTSLPSTWEAHLSPPRWVLNGERTRWFWILAASDAHGVLDRILETCNGVVHAMGWPRLYVRDSRTDAETGTETLTKTEGFREHEHEHEDKDKQDSFLGGRTHVSIAWALALTSDGDDDGHAKNGNGPSTEADVEADAEGNEKTQDPIIIQALQRLRVPIGAVKVKIGNTVAELPLGLPLDPARSGTTVRPRVEAGEAGEGAGEEMQEDDSAEGLSKKKRRRRG